MAVVVCFVNENKLSYLINNIGVGLLLCSGLVVATYVNTFSGYTILLLVSVCPLIMTTFKGNYFADENKSNFMTTYLPSLIKSAGYLLSAAAIYVAMLYIGKETFYGLLFGVAFALFLTFLNVIVKKRYKKPEIKQFFISFALDFVRFLSVGIILGAVVCALLYSMQLSNILFAVGGVVLCADIVLNNFVENRYTHLPKYVAMILILLSMLFI